MVVERFGNIAGGRFGVRESVRKAFGKWADTEPAAAAEWLDRQIAEGTLESKSLEGDGESEERILFEVAMVSALLKTDPAAASARVAALPENMRAAAFQSGFQLSPENYGSYAKVVRESLPAEDAGYALANRASELAKPGAYERVDDFITGSNATAEEKAFIVGNVILSGAGRNGENLDKARAWGATHAPGAVGRATGELFANIVSREDGDFKTTSELVLLYHANSGGDEVLASFLQDIALQDRLTAEAAPLIGQIKDTDLREEISNLPAFKKQLNP